MYALWVKSNFPLYDLHCVTTLRIQNYVDCNICVVPLLKASIRSTAPQTEQHSQSTEPLDKMPQCRKMSNVLQRRLVIVCRLTGSFIRCYKYDERQDNQSEMVFWIFLLRQMRLEHLEMCSHVHFPASYGLNHIKEGVWLATGMLTAKD